MILKLVRTPGIYLTGFMASGKTVIGRLLADRLGWTFIDLDAVIEAEQGTTIRSIFDTRGEEYFRQLETEAIRTRLARFVPACRSWSRLAGERSSGRKISKC